MLNVETIKNLQKELSPHEIGEIKRNPEAAEVDYKNVVKEQLEIIRSTSLDTLRAQNDLWLSESKSIQNFSIQEPAHKETTPLTDEDRVKIKEETGWSDEIINAIESWEEYEVYKKAGLEEREINGKPCLVRDDLDLEQKDEFGRTNRERMENGLAPLDKNGKPIELHHIGQKSDSPLAELTLEEHRGKGNDGILHDKNKDTEIDRIAFREEKEEHWKTRAGNAQEV